jgi:cytochrome oxidase Cu insertion factor (SCO1/SenC/PrrC family)
MQTFQRLTAAGALLAAATATSGAPAPTPGLSDLQHQMEMRQKFDRRRPGDLKVGDTAPDFTVQDLQGKTTVKLSSLRGKPVVLIFGSCT